MEVRCPNCTARYDVDPSLVSSGSVRLQCSGCSRTFRLQLAGALPEGWMVRRTTDGKVLALDGLPTLQRWIVEQKVRPEDELSRTGAQWKPLNGIVELAPFFELVRKAELTSSDSLDVSDLDALFDGIGSASDASSIEASLDTEAVSSPEDDLANVLLASLAQESERRPLSGINHVITPEVAATPTPYEARPAQPVIPVVTAPRLDDVVPAVVPPTEEPERESDRDILLPDDHDAHREVDNLLADAGVRKGPGTALIVIVVVLVVGAIAAVILSRLGPPAADAEGTESSTGQEAATGAPSEATPDVVDAAGVAQADDVAAPPDEPQIAAMVAQPNTDVVDTRDTTTADGESLAATTDAANDVSPDQPEEEQVAAATPGESSGSGTGTMRTGASTYVKRGDQAREQGRNAAAIENYEKALELRPNSVEAHAGLGWCYLSSGATARATGYFETTIELSPGYSKAYIGLAKAQQKAGKLAKALATYEAFIEKFPTAREVSIAEAQIVKIKAKLAEKDAKPIDPPKAPEKPPETSPPKDTVQNGSAGDAGDKRIIIIHKAE